VSNHTAVEHFEISLQTPSGEISTAVGVPTSFVPITAILPLMRSLGEEAQVLEQRRLLEASQRVSCEKGCAACCRMLVPISVPEAFALTNTIDRLDQNERNRLLSKLDLAQQQLAGAGILKQLSSLADSSEPLSDGPTMRFVCPAPFSTTKPAAFTLIDQQLAGNSLSPHRPQNVRR